MEFLDNGAPCNASLVSKTIFSIVRKTYAPHYIDMTFRKLLLYSSSGKPNWKKGVGVRNVMCMCIVCCMSFLRRWKKSFYLKGISFFGKSHKNNQFMVPNCGDGYNIKTHLREIWRRIVDCTGVDQDKFHWGILVEREIDCYSILRWTKESNRIFPRIDVANRPRWFYHFQSLRQLQI